MFQISLFSTLFFLNEPHKIVRVSVDIAEKYKDYSPKSTFVEKRKETKKKSHSVGKEHQRGEHHNSTLSVGLGQQHRKFHISTLIQLDWSINTDKHSKLQSHGGTIVSRVNKLARPTEATTSLDLP